MISVTARLIWLARGRLTDREPFAEVVDADADRDQQRQLLAGRERVEPRSVLELVEGGGAGADERRRASTAALLHPFGVVARGS